MNPPLPNVALNASFDELSSSVPATIGIAIARPGLAKAYSLGRWSTGVAWSTIKVPLAIAALRRDRTHAEPLVVKAITESDNHASEALWSLLGAPAVAARDVQAIIRESGDPATVVEARRIRAGFTAFGQTQWTLSRQAQFAANIADIPGSASVIDLMRQLTTDQRWGLATKSIATKGGWGPGLAGDYLVRQFAIVPTDAAQLGVALAVQAQAFQSGVEVLTAMTDWLVGHLPDICDRISLL
ncbi:hypothetical protein MSIMFI_05493 [Mycobacterium simulans]|uniref:serine hydrolase n=1 Tax=Mycobacterium simulans TaxID=627089 RepID=UPI00174E8ACD|nr:serine hydrolase [Mycobacterium simulans]SON63962.1 hypothetical protein MSIMFI_05493 [Mycobacterium simulans]